MIGNYKRVCDCTGKERIHLYLVGISVLFLVICGSVGAMIWFTNYERQRDIEKWQLVLGVMADEKAQSISDWVEKQFDVLEGLSQNGSLQLYTQLMVQRPEENQPNEPAQIDYLRNLIWATAQRTGFMDQREGTRIKANLAFNARAYIMLLSDEDTVITGTPGMPRPFPALKKAIRKVMNQGGRFFFNVFLNPDQTPLVGFIVPVFGLQKQTGQPRPVAVLFGAKDAEQGLFPLLRSQQSMTETDEAYLVQRHGPLVQYLSPLSDGTKALKRELPIGAELAGAKALREPGSSGICIDYRGKKVLFTSRSIPGLPWVLVQKVDAREAFAETIAHQRFLWTILFLTLLIVICLVVAAWWHGSTLKAQETAEALLEKSKRLESQTRLLCAISDNINDLLLLLDEDLHALFANKSLGKLFSVPAEDLKGKGLSSIFGPDVSKKLSPICHEALKKWMPVVQEISIRLNDDVFVFTVTAMPVAYPDGQGQSVLLSLHDVTWLKEAREKKERLMKALVKALMRSIDLYDPYSANHSANTAVVAVAIAKAMDLDTKTVSTVEIAANLCNIGKLSIPKEILTKTGPLTPDEEDIIRKEAFYVEKLLKDVPFDGPVVETITQKNEWIDGSGYPKGLKGEQIILPARILAAANAFVAMISPRSYRDALTVKEALEQMLNRADKQFDRQIVACLFHIAENFLDWSTWQEYHNIRVKKGIKDGG